MIRSVLVAAASAGVAVTAYLTVVHYREVAPLCLSSGCETVQRSRYAEFLGIPVAVLGLGAYTGLLLSAALRALAAVAAAAAIGLAGLVFALYLVYVQLAVLHAVCAWCIASDALLLVATAAALVRLLRAVE